MKTAVVGVALEVEVGRLGVRFDHSRAHHPPLNLREGREIPVRHEAPCRIPGNSREELEGRFLGLMAYPDPKG